MAIGRRIAPVLRFSALWRGALTSVVFAALWIGSGWYRLTWWRDPTRTISLVDVCQGRIELSRFGPLNGAKRAFYLGPSSPKAANRTRFRFWFTLERSPPVWRLWVPLWVPLAVIGGVPLGASAYVWHRARRRRKEGRCLSCDYDLRGLPSAAKCPECGAELVVPATAAEG